MQNFKYYNKCYLASIILISILLILPSCSNLTEDGFFRRRSLKKALLWAQQDSMRIADSLKSNLIVSDFAEEALEDSILPTEEEMLTGEDLRNQYHIIIGTFAEPENAKLVAAQFRSQGYQTSIISRTNRYGINLDMVSVKTFNNLEEASSYLKKFKSDVDSSAWMYQAK